MNFLSICTTFLLVTSVSAWNCDFDYGQRCFVGLPTASFVLLNETSDEPRQPASDVTAIETHTDDGDCVFPFTLGSFEMNFCEKSDPDLPATCPTGNSTGPRINCSDGEYGYAKFEEGETEARSYELEARRELFAGLHCLRFHYYLSDGASDATISVFLENVESNSSVTIATASSFSGNKWSEIRRNFQVSSTQSKIIFTFERKISGPLPFYFGVDHITIVNQPCEPITTTIDPNATTPPMISTTLPAGNTASPSSAILDAETTNATPVLPDGATTDLTPVVPDEETTEVSPVVPSVNTTTPTPIVPGDNTTAPSSVSPVCNTTTSTPVLPVGNATTTTPVVPSGNLTSSTAVLPVGNATTTTPVVPSGNLTSSTAAMTVSTTKECPTTSSRSTTAIPATPNNTASTTTLAVPTSTGSTTKVQTNTTTGITTNTNTTTTAKSSSNLLTPSIRWMSMSVILVAVMLGLRA